MKKTITEVVEVNETRHEFYCDECNEYLGTTYECDDGWYKKIGNLELSCNIFGWLRMKKCLCDKCRSKLVNKVRENLLNIGFVAE